MRKLFYSVLVVAFVWLFVYCIKSVHETEQAYGGSVESCIELGYEKAMCKRVFEW